MQVNIVRRVFADELPELGVRPLLARIYHTRGITHADQLARSLSALTDYQRFKDIDRAAQLIAQAVCHDLSILIIGDFDADGATSTAVAVRALRAMGARQVDFLVPNRFEYGYGLSPEIVDLALTRHPDLIITVDNGITSVAGVIHAKAHGLQVVITDHHLAGDELPEADAIVNPNQPGCGFPSKCLAGVGVIFYVMLAVRATLKAQSWFANKTVPNLARYLDLVALGTVADVVPLDHNNRIFVHQGLLRIRQGKTVPGILALLDTAKRDFTQTQAQDLGFAVGPRLNAAGRLDDMTQGIACLLTDDMASAQAAAQRLQTLNLERRSLEQDMKASAQQHLDQIGITTDVACPVAVVLYDAAWHQGVIGILASRLKDRFHRPVVCFSDAGDQQLKGSARSIKAIHIRDVLAEVARRDDQVIEKFGGHAAAAGLSIARNKLSSFRTLFETVVAERVTEKDLINTLMSDGALTDDDFTLSTAELIQHAGPWGQGFPEPLFDGQFAIVEQRVLAEKHLKLQLQTTQKTLEAIAFFVDREQWPTRAEHIRACYRLAVNEYRGRKKVQLIIEHMEPA